MVLNFTFYQSFPGKDYLTYTNFHCFVLGHQNKIIKKGRASWSISGCPVLATDALDLDSAGCQRAMVEVVKLNVRGVPYQTSLATLEHWANTQSQCWQPPQNWKKKDEDGLYFIVRQGWRAVQVYLLFFKTFWKTVLRWREVSLYVLNYNQTRFWKLWIIGSEAHLFLKLIG